MAAHREPLNPSADFERLRGIAKVYIGVAIFILLVSLAEVGPAGALFPCIMIFGARAALKGRRTGYYITYFFSLLMLPAMPLGTVLGWMTIKSLRRNRALFLKR